MHHFSLLTTQLMVKAVNGHGDSLTEQEFLIVMARKHLNTKPEHELEMTESFHAFDTDHDGTGSADNIFSMACSLSVYVCKLSIYIFILVTTIFMFGQDKSMLLIYNKC